MLNPKYLLPFNKEKKKEREKLARAIWWLHWVSYSIFYSAHCPCIQQAYMHIECIYKIYIYIIYIHVIMYAYITKIASELVPTKILNLEQSFICRLHICIYISSTGRRTNLYIYIYIICVCTLWTSIRVLYVYIIYIYSICICTLFKVEMFCFVLASSEALFFAKTRLGGWARGTRQ